MWWPIFLVMFCLVFKLMAGQAIVGNSVESFKLKQQHNFLVGIASLAATHENRTQCGRELEILLLGIQNREKWSLKVIDFFGSPPSTISWGNYFWLNSPDLCLDLNEPLTISLAYSQPKLFNVTSPVRLTFLVVYMNFTTPFFIDINLPFKTYIHLGLCLPESCSTKRIQQYANLYFQNQVLEIQQNFHMKMQAVEAKRPHFSWSYLKKNGCIIFFFIVFLCLFLPLAAEVVYTSHSKLQIQHNMHVKIHHSVVGQSPQFVDTIITPSSITNLSFQAPVKCSLWVKLLMCFRLVDNYAAVIRLDNSKPYKSFLPTMTGMRCIVCLWITVFHVYYYSLFAMSNVPYIFAKLEAFALQPIMQAFFYVDVFFVMSSFLLVNNFLSNAKQMKRISENSLGANVMLYLKFLLKRYLRLTPVMIVIMLLSTMVVDFLNMYTPFLLGEHSGLYCKTNWWYNLLYIHNLLDMNCICCSWTWYLACEMQYYIAFTTLLFIHAKYPKFGKMTFVALALGFVVIAWICNYANGITFQIDVIYSTLNQLYVKPWVRIMPYLGGSVMGWLMHYLNSKEELPRHDQQAAIPDTSLLKHWSKVFWFCIFVLYVITNFMSYWRATPKWAVASIMSVGKFIFSICIGSVIIMCALGRGGLLNSFLSARLFLFLNKFCFSIYMLAPIIVVAIFGLRNEPTGFTEVGSVTEFLGVVSLSLAAGFLLYLFVEFPMQKMSKVLLSYM